MLIMQNNLIIFTKRRNWWGGGGIENGKKSGPFEKRYWRAAERVTTGVLSWNGKIKWEEGENLLFFEKFTSFIMHLFCRISLVPATLPVRWTSSVSSSRLWPQRWAPIFISRRWAPVIIVLVVALTIYNKVLSWYCSWQHSIYSALK